MLSLYSSIKKWHLKEGCLIRNVALVVVLAFISISAVFITAHAAGLAGNVTSDPYVILTHELDEEKFEEDGTAPYIIGVESRLNLSDVTLYDEYPSDFGYKDSSIDPKTTFNNTVIWDNLTLVAGERTLVYVSFTYDVNTPADELPGRLIDFNAYATWDNGTRRSANTTVSVLGV